MWQEANSLLEEFVDAQSLLEEEEKDRMFEELTGREKAFSKVARAKKNVFNRSILGPKRDFA